MVEGTCKKGPHTVVFAWGDRRGPIADETSRPESSCVCREAGGMWIAGGGDGSAARRNQERERGDCIAAVPQARHERKR